MSLALGWGYWHVSTHGAANIHVYDVSLKTDSQLYGTVTSARLAFLDAKGAVLARASVQPPSGVASIEHPKTGDCRKEEQRASASREAMDAWRECIGTQFKWLPAWVREARYASVAFERCRIERVPVFLRESKEDWWLW